jgi:pimeloyl-ACP methyl ester carboxylesterase
MQHDNELIAVSLASFAISNSTPLPDPLSYALTALSLTLLLCSGYLRAFRGTSWSLSERLVTLMTLRDKFPAGLMRALCSLGILLLFAHSATAQDSSVVTVDGRPVEVRLVGTGTPLLVLEGGVGADASAWNSVIVELAKHTRVLTYSRSGHGRSGVAQGDGSPTQAVRELHQLLNAIGNGSQIVIAGHSYGGILARLYASTYPEQVAGLVLVDATHESQFARWEALLPGLRVAELLETGLDRLPPPLRSDVQHMIAIQRVQRVEGMTPLVNMPLAVITALKPCAPDREPTCRDPRALQAWRQMHDEWFARSTSALRLVSHRTEHYVMTDQPDLVIRGVQFVIEQVRASAGRN